MMTNLNNFCLFIFVMMISGAVSRKRNQYDRYSHFEGGLFPASQFDPTSYGTDLGATESPLGSHPPTSFPEDLPTYSPDFVKSKPVEKKPETSSAPPSSGVGKEFNIMDINTWESIPDVFFQPTSNKQNEAAAKTKNIPLSQSEAGAEPSLAWDYTNVGLGSGGFESGSGVSQDVFLPLADHSPGSIVADQPVMISDWAVPPVKNDTAKYRDEPTPKPVIQRFSDGESMARAILSGTVKKWEWTYSTTLGAGLSSKNGDRNDQSITCCQRLPYICGVDGMCVIGIDECKDFCACAANPQMPHCMKIIPEIKRTMAALEKKILAKIAKEMSLASTPSPMTTEETRFVHNYYGNPVRDAHRFDELSIGGERYPSRTLETQKLKPSTSVPSTKRPQSSVVNSSQPHSLYSSHLENTDMTSQYGSSQFKMQNQFSRDTVRFNPNESNKISTTISINIITPRSPATPAPAAVRTAINPTQSVSNPTHLQSKSIINSEQNTLPPMSILSKAKSKTTSTLKQQTQTPPTNSVPLKSQAATHVVPMKQQSTTNTVPLRQQSTTIIVPLKQQNTTNVSLKEKTPTIVKPFTGTPVKLPFTVNQDAVRPSRRTFLSPTSLSSPSPPLITKSVSYYEIKKQNTTLLNTFYLTSTVTAINIPSFGYSNLGAEKTLHTGPHKTTTSYFSNFGSWGYSGIDSLSPNQRKNETGNRRVTAADTIKTIGEIKVELTSGDILTLSDLHKNKVNTTHRPSTTRSLTSKSTTNKAIAVSSPRYNTHSNDIVTVTASANSTRPISDMSKISHIEKEMYSTQRYHTSSQTFKTIDKATTTIPTTTTKNQTLTGLSKQAAQNSDVKLKPTTTTTTENILTSLFSNVSAISTKNPGKITQINTVNFTTKTPTIKTSTTVSRSAFTNTGKQIVLISTPSTSTSSTSGTSTPSTSNSSTSGTSTTGTSTTSTSTASISTTGTSITGTSATGTSAFGTSTTSASTTSTSTTGSSKTSTSTISTSTTSTSTTSTSTAIISTTDTSTTSISTSNSTTGSSTASTSTTGTSTASTSATSFSTVNISTYPLLNQQNTFPSTSYEPHIRTSSYFTKNEALLQNVTTTHLIGNASINNVTDELLLTNTNSVSTESYIKINDNTTIEQKERDSKQCRGCDKMGGVCVIREDGRSICVVVMETCDNIHCNNGLCVSRDGHQLCECLRGWSGRLCEHPCSLTCGERSFCSQEHESNTTACVCRWQFAGKNCEKTLAIISRDIGVPMFNKGLDTWEVGVVSSAAAVVLALLCVLSPYYLWKKQWLPIRKFIFFFHYFEDNDDKEFDAFISFNNTPRDERFVFRHLYPKLDKELDFRLCLHCQDISPGESLSSNIVRAVESSRRIILILSPNYVISEWNRPEYLKVQADILNFKNKIIPIILENVNGLPELDSGLKTITESANCLKWPGEEKTSNSAEVVKFWKLLELCMPKRRHAFGRSSSHCSDDPILASKTSFNSIAYSLTYKDNLTGSSHRGGTNASDSGHSSEKTVSVDETKRSSIGKLRFPDVSWPNLRANSVISFTPPMETCSIASGSDDTGIEINSRSSIASREESMFVKYPQTRAYGDNVIASSLQAKRLEMKELQISENNTHNTDINERRQSTKDSTASPRNASCYL